MSSSDIPSQSLSIAISGFSLPGSVQDINAHFDMTIYYSSSGYLVANGNQNSTFTTTAGEIQTVTINSSS